MQGPLFFDNQIIKVQNLEFWRDSNSKNITDNFLTFTGKLGGVSEGFYVTSGIGLNINISQGVAYDNFGQRMEMYSGMSNFSIYSGIVYATLQETDYNPDPNSFFPSFPPYSGAQTNKNPITGSGVNVSAFDTVMIGQVSGIGSIPLARINCNNNSIQSIDSISPYRQDLLLLGILDVNTSSINGGIISSGTIDSNQFTNPLHYDFAVSGTNIYNTVSGMGNIGSISSPFNSISAKTLNVTNISGMSPINLLTPLYLDNNNAIINVNGTNPLIINPSGQDVRIGGGTSGTSLSGTQGTLYVSNIKGQNNVSYYEPNNYFPILTIESSELNINLTGNPSDISLQVNTVGYNFTNTGLFNVSTNGNLVQAASGNYNVTAQSIFQNSSFNTDLTSNVILVSGSNLVTLEADNAINPDLGWGSSVVLQNGIASINGLDINISATNKYLGVGNINLNANGTLELAGGTGGVYVSGNTIINGTLTLDKYTSGQVISMKMLSSTDLGMPASVSISSSGAQIASYNYTPQYNNSYIIIEFTTNYTSSGSGTDKWSSWILANEIAIGYSRQNWNNATGGGTRSGVLFPLMARYTNNSNTPIPFKITAGRISSDDNFIFSGDSSTWMKITEIAQ